MTAAAIVLAGFALLLLAWSYLVYPWLVLRLARRVPARDEASPDALPSVDVLVSAFNEEALIGARVANLLAQDYRGRVGVLIGCDGCRDWTAVRARESGSDRVQVAEFMERRGKAAVLNELVRRSRSEVLVFTDANSTFASDAIRRLVAPFADPAVGAVCGRLVLEAPDADPSPESEFWDRETRLKEAEGRLGVCLGANGAIYAVRRDLVRPLPEWSALDDFLIPARIAAAGRRVVFAADAIAREPAGADVAEEASRRLRIGIGAGGILLHERGLLDFRHRPLLALAFLSRKAARWLGPVVAFGAILLALFSPSLRPYAAAAAVALGLIAVSIPLRARVRGGAGRLYYFAVINLALAAGVVAGLAGFRRPAWPRTNR